MRFADPQNLVAVVTEAHVQASQGSIARIRDPEQRAAAGDLDEQALIFLARACTTELSRAFFCRL